MHSLSKSTYLLFAFVTTIFFACSKEKKRPYQFQNIKGITYYEVRRAFGNDLVFDKQGFQQEPEWKIRFVSEDSVLAYSPTLNKMSGFHLYYDHGSVYNFAKEWFRIKKVTADSLVFQRLQVVNKEVSHDAGKDVFMTFYADGFIQKKLKTTPELLRQPKPKDTLFVRKMAAATNKNIYDSIRFFAARKPVKFIPKSNKADVEIIENDDPMVQKSKSYAYLYPSYKISINKAYKEFAYTFTASVDSSGKIHVYDFLAIDEYRDVRKKVLQGIADVYIKNLFTVVPGSTLGIKHNSLITLAVKGKK